MKRAEKKGAQNSPRDPHMCRLCAEGWDRHAKDSGALTASNILSWSVPCAECLSTSSVRFAVFLSPVSCWVKKKNRKYAISSFILTTVTSCLLLKDLMILWRVWFTGSFQKSASRCHRLHMNIPELLSVTHLPTHLQMHKLLTEGM